MFCFAKVYLLRRLWAKSTFTGWLSDDTLNSTLVSLQAHLRWIMIMTGKEIYMSRVSKILMISMVVLFVLACNFVTQPVRDVQNLAGTAEAIGSAIPIETLQALPSAIASMIPAETLQALPSSAPTIEALATQFGNALNPQGAPAQEWKGVPIMPQATAGQEFTENGTNIYSFKASVTAQEVQDFYKDKMTALGWNQSFSMPGGSEGGFMAFQKDSSFLTIVITSSKGAVVVLLTLA
jgi:hypothetical protein